MMGHAWLKHREALLALVIILMIGAIGSLNISTASGEFCGWLTNSA